MVAHVGQPIGQPIGVALRAGEDERLLHIALRQDVVEQRVLVVAVVRPVQALLDVLVRVGVRRHVDALRVAQQVMGEAAHVAGEGGAEHHGLAGRRHVFGDRRDVVDEAHVEHAVGFVEHQHFDVFEHALAGLQVVEQAPRGRDQDVQWTTQCGNLCRVRHATDDGGNAQTLHMAAVHRRRLGDLHRQFARGRQHQDARTVNHALFTALVVAAGGQDALQRGQDEGSRLAAAGAGRHHQVSARDRRRNRGGLDFGGGGVAGFGDGFHQGFVQAEGGKAHGQISFYAKTRRRATPAKERQLAACRHALHADQ